MSVSPKIIQEHVFNTFNTKLRGYEQHDVTLSTKARSVHSVAAMIEQHLQNKPIDKMDAFFNIGEEDLLAFKRRRKF